MIIYNFHYFHDMYFPIIIFDEYEAIRMNQIHGILPIAIIREDDSGKCEISAAFPRCLLLPEPEYTCLVQLPFGNQIYVLLQNYLCIPFRAGYFCTLFSYSDYYTLNLVMNTAVYLVMDKHCFKEKIHGESPCHEFSLRLLSLQSLPYQLLYHNF